MTSYSNNIAIQGECPNNVNQVNNKSKFERIKHLRAAKRTDLLT